LVFDRRLLSGKAKAPGLSRGFGRVIWVGDAGRLTGRHLTKTDSLRHWFIAQERRPLHRTNPDPAKSQPGTSHGVCRRLHLTS
jgi:hypothetical protein